MIIHSAHEVEWTTEDEKKADVLFSQLLDQGHGIPTAAARVREAYPNLDPAFYRWLNDEPLVPSV